MYMKLQNMIVVNFIFYYQINVVIGGTCVQGLIHKIQKSGARTRGSYIVFFDREFFK